MGLIENFLKKLEIDETCEKKESVGNEVNSNQLREIIIRNNGKAERKIVPVIIRKAVEKN